MVRVRLTQFRSRIAEFARLEVLAPLAVALVAALVYSLRPPDPAALPEFLGSLGTILGIVSAFGMPAATVPAARSDSIANELRKDRSEFLRTLAALPDEFLPRLATALDLKVSEGSWSREVARSRAVLLRQFAVAILQASDDPDVVIDNMNSYFETAGLIAFADPLRQAQHERTYAALPPVEFYSTLLRITADDWFREHLPYRWRTTLERQLGLGEVSESLKEIRRLRSWATLGFIYLGSSALLGLVAIVARTQSLVVGYYAGELILAV
ncbi:MAG: hypothetical protein M3P18_21250 [Actinomycetota bacterium]|nr:hypothetical protein [Actinomycetota bacterium]